VTSNGFTDLTSVDRVELVNNRALSSVDAFASVTTATAVYVFGSTNLRDVGFLRGLTQVGSLQLISVGVRRIDALGNLRSADYLNLATGELESLAGLERLRDVSRLDIVGGTFADVAPLASLTRLGALALWGNAIVDLTGLRGITELDWLSLSGLGVQDLTGLENLGTIRQDLTIELNDSLVTLGGLTDLATVGGNFSVRNNPALPTCRAEQLRDRIGVDNIGGVVELFGNDDTATCAP
jgi:hypothetical protein